MTAANGSIQSVPLIEQLPIEILDRIFEEYVESHESPCKLALVSKTWKSLALDNPNLWKYIFIYSPNPNVASTLPDEWRIPGLSHPIYTLGRSQICRENEELTEAFIRARSVPLSFQLYWAWEDDQDNSDLLRFLGRILTPPVSHQTESMDIYLGRAPTSSVLDATRGKLPGPFPLLRSLIIGGHRSVWARPLCENLHESISKLLDVRINFKIDESFAQMQFWKDIHTLRFSLRAVDIPTLNTIVPLCAKLRHLEVPNGDWPDARTPEDAVANVTDLTIRCTLQDISRMKLPNIRSMVFMERLDEPGSDEVPKISRLSLPQLTKMHVISLQLHLLTLFDMPRLTDLRLSKHIYSSKSPPRPREQLYPKSLFTTSKFPNIRVLSMEYPCEEKVFINALSAFPNVQSLRIVQNIGGPKTYGAELLEVLASRSREEYCTHLEEFRLGDDQNRTRLSRNTIDEIVSAILVHRTTMTRFDVYWEGEDENYENHALLSYLH